MKEYTPPIVITEIKIQDYLQTNKIYMTTSKLTLEANKMHTYNLENNERNLELPKS